MSIINMMLSCLFAARMCSMKSSSCCPHSSGHASTKRKSARAYPSWSPDWLLSPRDARWQLCPQSWIRWNLLGYWSRAQKPIFPA
jgi:hypothetical protein